jgi:phosphonopyruvate decarboxylase
MIESSSFYQLLTKHSVDFFSGVPDSLLKSFCAYLTDNVDSDKHIISANEGSAVALASGYHLATGKIPLVYMQNSGIGNAINPLLSLADSDVYSIPMVLVIGWRGEPGIKDEPQHVKQGKVTCSLLEAMNIPYSILSDNESNLSEQIEQCMETVKKTSAPYALIVRKDTFSPYTLQNKREVQASMSREQAIEKIMMSLSSSDIVISTTGMASRELYELREKHTMGHEKDFLTVGSMGHASQIALAIALNKKQRRVVCIDGDGATIMHMGSLAIIGSKKPTNMCHIVLNNAAHDSVGGQPTVAQEINLTAIALACGYKKAIKITNIDDIDQVIKHEKEGPVFVEIIVTTGSRKDLGRPKESPQENKKVLMNFIKEEGK